MMKDKRIIIATSWKFPHVGGVSSHISLLAERLQIPETEVLSYRHIFEGSNYGSKRYINAVKRVLRRSFGLETISMNARALSFVIGEYQFDIIHCHDAMATWAASLARERTRRKFKIVSTVHGPVSRHMIEEGYHASSPDVKKVQQCEMKAWADSDAIIAVDSRQAAILMEQGVPADKITIIPNAVDVERIERLAKAVKMGKTDDTFWILVPRRLSPKNGVEVAIKAIGLLDDRPLLLLAGSGKERSRLEGMVKDTGLARSVVFLGDLQHEMLFPLMEASDVVLIPSVPIHGIEEATSIAALEAMALGKTVVASAIGGLKEIIRDQECGVLVPPGNHAELSRVIAALMKDNAQIQTLGEAAHETVLKDFSADLWFQRHLDIYTDVLASNGS